MSKKILSTGNSPAAFYKIDDSHTGLFDLNLKSPNTNMILTPNNAGTDKKYVTDTSFPDFRNEASRFANTSFDTFN